MKSKITIKEIADLAKTSKTTVSFYLNGKFNNMSLNTRKNIEKIIKKYNYTPNSMARGLSTNKSKIIGVIVGDISNSYSSQLVKGIENKLNEEEYQIAICTTNYDSQKEIIAIDKLIAMGVDGIIIQATKHLKFDKYKDLKNIAFIDSHNDLGQDYISVKSDNFNSVYNCIKEIQKKDYYNEYIIIGANMDNLTTINERVDGFIKALDSSDIVIKKLIIHKNFNEKNLKNKLMKKIDLDKKTLIFSPNCWMLPIIYKALNIYASYIPSKIALLGFDNIEWVNFVTPAITTIVQPAFEQGYKLAENLIKVVNGEKLEKNTETFMCDINWKESIIL